MFFVGIIVVCLAASICCHNESIASDILSTSLPAIMDTQTTREHNALDKKLDSILAEVRHTALIRALEELATRMSELDEREGLHVATYVRWGRTECPGNGSLTMFEGYAAAGHYTHTGASPNMLCLPRNPEWGQYRDAEDDIGAHIYGVEYEQILADRANAIFGKSLHDRDVPCTVCESSRKSMIMIAGRVTCYAGWTREYWGYIMTGHYSHTSQGDYHCIDANPESLEGGESDQNGHLLYFTEVRCGALRCPPYVQGRELPCVVCTK